MKDSEILSPKSTISMKAVNMTQLKLKTILIFIILMNALVQSLLLQLVLVVSGECLSSITIAFTAWL